MAWLSGWNNRIKLTIDSSKADAALTDFPVAVVLSTSAGITSTDVSDVFDRLSYVNRKKCVFTLSDGTTRLVSEIEHWDQTNEKAVFHVRVPSVASGSDGDLYLYYDAEQSDQNTRSLTDAGDTFTGDNDDAPTLEKWAVVETTNSTIDIQSNKLKLTFVGGSGEYCYAKSQYIFSGDFSIQVDFDSLVTGTTTGTGFELLIREFNNGDDRLYLKASYDAGSKWASDAWIAGAAQGCETAARTNDYGSVKIARSGTTITLSTKDGTGEWSTLRTVNSFSSGDMQIRPAFWCATSGGNVSVSIDNLTINSAGSISGFVDDTNSTTAETVWDYNFAGVWHMAQDPSGGSDCVLDSTSYGNDGTPAGSMTAGDLVDGQIGKALDFDGTDDEIQIGTAFDPYDANDEVTLEVVFNPPNITTDNYVAAKGDDTVSNSYGLGYYLDYSYTMSNLDGPVYWADENYGLTAGNWFYTAGTVKDTAIANFLGTAKVVETGEDLNTGGSYQFRIGSSGRLTQYTASKISEVRASQSVRSDAWLKATYNTLKDSLLTLSAPEHIADITVSTPAFTSALLSGGLISASLPALTAALYTRPWIAATLPAFTSEILGGGIVSVSLPVFETAIEGTQILSHGDITAALPSFEAFGTCSTLGPSGDLSVTFPVFTATLRNGVEITVTLPSFVTSGAGTAGLVGNIATRLPVFNTTGTGLVEQYVSIATALPSLVAAGAGTVNNIGSVTVTMPAFLSALQGIPGKTGDIAAIMPSLIAAGAISHLPTGEITVTLPAIGVSLAGHTDRFSTCNILRYNDKADCVGDMSVTIPAFETEVVA